MEGREEERSAWWGGRGVAGGRWEECGCGGRRAVV